MPRTFDPFRALSESEREEQLSGLERVLEERDGAVDLPNLRLEKREAWMRPLEQSSPCWRGSFDPEGFRRVFYGRERLRLDPRTTWLLAVARSNESEHFGVQWDHARVMSGGYVDPGPFQTTILAEEDYHSRILRAACRVFGVRLEFGRPGWLMRNFIRGTTYLPDAIRYVPILCGEVMGTIVFSCLLEKLDLFAEQPEVRERLQTLLGEVLTDEALHVAYCRARMAPLGLRVARRLAPLVVLGLLREVPQILDLGLTRRELLRRMRSGVEVPAGCGWLAREPALSVPRAIARV